MLNLRFGESSRDYGTVRPIHGYFQMEFERYWFDDPFIQEMVLDIDRTLFYDRGIFVSSLMGPLAPTELGGGTKVLICSYFLPEREYYATSCGDNCADWLLRIGDVKGSRYVINYMPLFTKDDFSIRVVNTGKIVHNRKDLFKQLMLVREDQERELNELRKEFGE